MILKSPMKHMAIIPARLGSTRLPEKPLQLIKNKPLIVHVAEEVQKTKLFDQVYVATDSVKIVELFRNLEVKVVMTSVDHQSGTDRIFEASQKISENFDTVFNIQGDEPFIYKDDLMKIKNFLESGAQMVSLYEKLKAEDVIDSNKVKVILDNCCDAIYFSRFGIPFSRESSNIQTALDHNFIGKHIGIYAYSKEFLKSFCEHPMGYHENFEKLEQLRALQMGVKIKMIKTENSYQGVDTIKDLEQVNEKLKKDGEDEK